MAATCILFPNDWTHYLFSTEKKTSKQMKIVTRNGAFRKQFEYISDFNADNYMIGECENPAESRQPAPTVSGNHKASFDYNKNKLD